MKSRALLWTAILLIVGSTALIAFHVAIFFASGDCVSAGGSYDYSARACDFAKNHPHVLLHRAWTFWLAMVLGSTGCWILGRGEDRNAR